MPSNVIKYFIMIIFLFLSASDSASGTIIYTYDDLNRLKKAVYENGMVMEFTYDEVGNRLTKIDA